MSFSIDGYPVRSLDFELIPDIFTKEIETIFPVAIKVDICFFPDKVEDADTTRSDDQAWIMHACSSGEPVRNGKILVMPVSTEDDKRVALIIDVVDRALLAKMSSDWLLDVQARIQGRLEFIRRIFVEPLSGLYNGRCLVHAVKRVAGVNDSAYLFLISTDDRSRGISSFKKISQTAGLLEAVTSLPVFSLGARVFGLLFFCGSRQDVLDFSTKLLSRMKRETFSRVHIGIASLPAQKNHVQVDAVFDNCWKALEFAEKRGPFGKYLLDESNETAESMFVVPSGKVLAGLRGCWRRFDSFGLLLIQSERWEGRGNIAEAIKKELRESEKCVAIAENKAYVFLPFFSEEKARERSMELHDVITKQHTDYDFSTGFCFWPNLRYTKTSTAVNCQKAIQHGLFFGSGQLTFFDSVSLNVSGDCYFDEGDYRQAAKDYKSGLEMKPDDVNLMNSLGVALTEMNRNSEAIIWFQKVLDVQPDNFMALVNLGFTYRRLKQSNQALSCFEKAYSSAQNHGDTVMPELYMQLGRLYCQTGRFEDGLRILRRWDEDGSGKKEFQLYRLLGEALMETGRKKEAIVALQRALQLHPGNAESLSMLGFLYYVTGEGNEIGLSLCQKAVDLDEHNSDIWHRLAMVLFFSEKVDKAREAVRTSLSLQRNNMKSRLLLARIYEYNKKYYYARRIYANLAAADEGQVNEVKIARQSLERMKR